MCFCNVPRLRSLIAAGQEYHHLPVPLHKVNPVAGTVIDAHFRDACSRRFNISEKTKLQPVNAGCNSGGSLPVPKLFKPSFKHLGFSNLDHTQIVLYRLQKGKKNISPR